MDSTVVKEKIILGIDPGTTILGYSLIVTSGKTITILCQGVIKLNKLRNHYEKLSTIYHRLNELVSSYQPVEMAIEAPFYAKNVQSMLKLGRAQGVAITVALARGLRVYEYAPRKIKQAVTGNGNASKEQVALMLQQTLEMKELPEYLDESDALATAVCHHYQSVSIVGTGVGTGKAKSGNTWEAFLKANPDRLAK